MKQVRISKYLGGRSFLSLLPVFLVVPVVLLVVVAPSPAHATGTTFDLRYEMQWGNVNVGEAEASWVFTPNTFEMVAKSRTVGISDKIRKYRGNSAVQGRIHNDTHIPESLNIKGIYKGLERDATSIWNRDDGQISTVRTPALDLEKVHPLQNRRIQGSVDPFTAMLRALHTVKLTGSCDSSHKIYDGLRTAELRIHDLGIQRLTSDRPNSFDGEVIKCGLTSKPTGGHRLKSRWTKKERKIDDTIIFIAEIEPGLYLPVRIEIKTFLGKITTRLVMTSLSIKAIADDAG